MHLKLPGNSLEKAHFLCQGFKEVLLCYQWNHIYANKLLSKVEKKSEMPSSCIVFIGSWDSLSVGISFYLWEVPGWTMWLQVCRFQIWAWCLVSSCFPGTMARVPFFFFLPHFTDKELSQILITSAMSWEELGGLVCLPPQSVGSLRIRRIWNFLKTNVSGRFFSG